MASSGWKRALGNARSFVGNAMGGLRGTANLASWAVAGTLAYFLWVKPAQELKREQEVCGFCPNLIVFRVLDLFIVKKNHELMIVMGVSELTHDFACKVVELIVFPVDYWIFFIDKIRKF